MPLTIQEGASGQLETPTIEGCLGLGVWAGQLPVQLRLVLSDGRQIHLPIQELPLRRLYDTLKHYFDPEQATFPP